MLLLRAHTVKSAITRADMLVLSTPYPERCERLAQ